MSEWPKGELRKIAEVDDLHIAPFREDGTTYGTPTWIWSVAVGNALYVRAYHGRKSSWYQAAIRQKAGRIIAAGMTREVAFDPVDGPLNDAIDDAYRAKYRDSPYLSPMIAGRARAATVRIGPRNVGRRSRPTRGSSTRGGGSEAIAKKGRMTSGRINRIPTRSVVAN